MSITQTLNRHDRTGLVLNMGLAIGAAAAVQAVVLFTGQDAMTGRELRLWFEPPEWAVTAVWLVLFALMATARWMLNEYTIVGVVPARRMTTVLIIASLLCPLYVPVSGSAIAGFLGNMATIVIAAVAIGLAWLRSRDAAFLLVPLVLWLSFATLLIFVQPGQLQPTQ